MVSLVASTIFILNSKWGINNLTPLFTNGFSGYSAGVALLIMKFIGFDLIPQLSEEANFPKEVYVIYTSMKAMDLTTWGVLALYFALGIPFWLYAKSMQKKKPDEWGAVILNPDRDVEIQKL